MKSVLHTSIKKLYIHTYIHTYIQFHLRVLFGESHVRCVLRYGRGARCELGLNLQIRLNKVQKLNICRMYICMYVLKYLSNGCSKI